MSDFNASLIREKIVFMEGGRQISGTPDEDMPLVRSNRIFLELAQGEMRDRVVVRAHNMHSTLRLAAKVVQEYQKSSGFCVRDPYFRWEPLWQETLSAYEHKYAPDAWAAIYADGENIFRTTESQVVDVVEKCALLSTNNYDAALHVTEKALNRIGRDIKIAHTSNVAGVFDAAGDQVRCGLIHRSRGGDSMFNFTATGGARMYNGVAQAFCTAAAFLEGLDLRFYLRTARARPRGLPAQDLSRDQLKIQHAMARQVALMREIQSYEESYTVKYRPEKPDFTKA